MANKEQLFQDGACCDVVFKAVQWLEDQNRWEWYCAMIMPDHLHVVVKIEKGWSLKQLMHSLKSYTAKKINNLTQREGEVWQEGYYDHCIRNEEALMKVTLYCYNNPIRKGLVAKVSDYPYWRCKFDMESSGQDGPPTMMGIVRDK